MLDARPENNARANAIFKGGGFESEAVYKNCVFTFCNIHNIHAVTKAHKAMFELAYDPKSFVDNDSFDFAINATGYYQLVSTILDATNQVVNSIVNKQNNVLVHCSDGWDRTAQMSSLSQMMLSPKFRTINGFCDLIEKDWLHFGHKFHERLGFYLKKRSSEESPIFIQFLSCCHLIKLRYPTDFEWNEEMLLFIANEMLSGKYGTFLGESPKERQELKLADNTKSIWSDIKGEARFVD